jgi:hypothetical protein
VVGVGWCRPAVAGVCSAGGSAHGLWSTGYSVSSVHGRCEYCPFAGSGKRWVWVGGPGTLLGPEGTGVHARVSRVGPREGFSALQADLVVIPCRCLRSSGRGWRWSGGGWGLVLSVF